MTLEATEVGLGRRPDDEDELGYLPIQVSSDERVRLLVRRDAEVRIVDAEVVGPARRSVDAENRLRLVPSPNEDVP